MLLQRCANGWLRFCRASRHEVVAADDRGHDVCRARPLLLESATRPKRTETHLNRRVGLVFAAYAAEELVEVVHDPRRLHGCD